MKQVILCLGLSLLAINGYSDQQADNASQSAAAKAAIQELAGALQAELKDAIQSGGPVAAIEVCNTEAMPITRKVSAEQGLQVSRVSLKNRNPSNQPNEWQTAVLEEFERQKAAGKDVATLVWSETVETGDVREFRFMKAIPTGDVCLLCHGAQLAPGVSQVLAERYPDDKATGFAVGDIRGAFVVTSQSADAGGN